MLEDPQDSERFLKLLSQHERPLFRYALQLMPHLADAEDLLQDAKISMLRNFHQFQPESNFPAWARRILFNQAVTRHRQQRRDASVSPDDLFRVLSETIDQSADRLQARRHALPGCLKKLDSEHRRIIQWRHWEGLSIEIIAQKSGRTMAAVYRLLSRIRHKLAACIDQKLAMEQKV